VIKITPFFLINKYCILVSFLYLPDFTGTQPQQYFPLVNGMFFNQKKRDKLFLFSLKNSLHLTIGITIIPNANFFFFSEIWTNIIGLYSSIHVLILSLSVLVINCFIDFLYGLTTPCFCLNNYACSFSKNRTK
jgi:hypothetical protein